MIKHMDVIDGLKEIQSESVDCIIIDPPYNIGKKPEPKALFWRYLL